jgi:hypothetical protein
MVLSGVDGIHVGMYLRTTQRRRKDGSLVRYLQLAHNRRAGGVTRAEVLLNLGREDELDVEGLRRLARSIRRYTDPGEEDGRIEPAEGLEAVGSRPLGGAWLLDALWRRLGVAEALRGLLGPRRFATDVERVLFALVANRALAPCSKLAAAEWASEDVAIPGLARMDDDQAYRALDLLVEADAEAKVQEAVFFACADLLNLEVDLLFFDTTSTYFEAEPDGEEQEQAPFRALGHSNVWRRHCVSSQRGVAKSPACSGLTWIRRPLRLPRRTWTAASSPRWTRCNTVWRARPSARAASLSESQPSGASSATLARSSALRRIRQGAVGVGCSPAMKPSRSQR